MQTKKTVVITGANGLVGRALLDKLAESEFHTVAIVRRFTALNADHVVVDSLDGPEARAALQRADLVVHLAGALVPGPGDSYESANLFTAQAVARAMWESPARRIIFLSYVGAREDSPNPYLRAKFEAEAILKATGKDVVVFRCSHILGGPDNPGAVARACRAGVNGVVRVLGDGKQVVAPVCLTDVVDAILAALRHGPAGIYELAGPEEIYLDEFVGMVNHDTVVRIEHVPARVARFLGWVKHGLTPALVDVVLRDSTGDPARAVATFGLRLTPPSRDWGRLEGRSAAAMAA